MIGPSKKVLSEIASGTRDRRGRKKVPIEVLNAKRADQRAAIHAAIKEAGKKVVDKVFGKVKRVKTDRQRAVEAADKWFSIFIRLRDAGPDGRVTCVTCSHTGPWRSLQNGHFVTRGHQSTRYDERNCNTQCRGCNYNGGQHLKHATAIDRKYGEGTATAIEQKGRQRCKRTLSDLQFIADSYRARVELAKVNSPGKFTTS